MKIYCVIVTFNRLDLLKNTLEAVRRQRRMPECVFVVNNASTDGTAEYLDSLASNSMFRTCHESQNRGGAGGFHTGVKLAYEAGADWIWLLDDDTEPREDALEQLVRPLEGVLKDRQVGFLASRVTWKDGSICHMNTPIADADWPELLQSGESLIKVRSASFVSTLINAQAVRKVGYPVSEFFIWYDDTEFTSRISRHFDSYFVPDSVVRHLTPDNLRPMDFVHLNTENCWKYAYGVRNECATICARSRFGALKGLYYALRQASFAWEGTHSFTLAGRIFFAAARGMFFRYEKLIARPNE